MKITNETNLPRPIVDSLAFDDYDRGDSNRSVTQLIDAPQIAILRKENEYSMDAADMAWLVLGKAMHHWFEIHTRNTSEQTAEERLFAEVDGWTISGAIDIQNHRRTVRLVDYKCTSVWSIIYGKEDWEQQLNVYAWLVDVSGGKPVDRLQICAILRDWSRHKVGTQDYPQAPIVMVDVPLWSFKQRDTFVRERVAIHQAAEFDRLVGNPLPHCTAKERWYKPGKIAVKKKGNKRAMKLFDDIEDAERYREENETDKVKLEIEVRDGAATRCEENYCGVAEFCPQFMGATNA